MKNLLNFLNKWDCDFINFLHPPIQPDEQKVLPTAPPIPTVPQPISTQIKTQVSKITQWAQAIVHWEGHFDGNLKYSTLTASWGATKGRPATDGGFFCEWQSEATGFLALVNFLTLGCENQLLDFHQSRTLESFTKVFAGNPPQGYIDGIAHDLDCPLDINIATFL